MRSYFFCCFDGIHLARQNSVSNIRAFTVGCVHAALYFGFHHVADFLSKDGSVFVCLRRMTKDEELTYGVLGHYAVCGIHMQVNKETEGLVRIE